MPERPAKYEVYRGSGDAVRLVEAAVLFADLLGTKAGAAEEAHRYLEVTRTALVRANNWANGGADSHTVVRWFSDNVAMADPLEVGVPEGRPNELAFGFHLMTAGWMQLELAMMGLFARGGMAFGPFYADETFIYGQALIDAYDLESKVAIYPRIVLSEALAQYAREQLIEFGAGATEVHRTLIAIDPDGLPFVNYLQSVASDEPGDLEACLINHKGHIQARLEKHRGEPAVHLKYRWLADYHDRFCRLKRLAEHRADLMIGPPEGPSLVPFAEDVPTPELPSHDGLDL